MGGERQALYLPEFFAHTRRARVKSASNKAFAFSLATMLLITIGK